MSQSQIIIGKTSKRFQTPCILETGSGVKRLYKVRVNKIIRIETILLIISIFQGGFELLGKEEMKLYT